MSTQTEARYGELVRRGREAREQADNVQWVEGDLALEIEALPDWDRPRDPETGEFVATADHALRRYAEDIDLNYASLKNYRATAKAWPPARRRAGVSWGVHRELNSFEDRFDLIRDGLTRREVRSIVRQRNKANYSGEPGWHELIGTVGDTLKKAQKELTRAEAVINDPGARLREKAGRYADWAEDIATRLRRMEEGVIGAPVAAQS